MIDRRMSSISKAKKSWIKTLKVLYYRQGKTLTVWFGDPDKEYICQETGEEIVLMKDVNERVIGFQRLNISLEETGQTHLRRQ